jgi:hypothetical protein
MTTACVVAESDAREGSAAATGMRAARIPATIRVTKGREWRAGADSELMHSASARRGGSFRPLLRWA